ncbi:acyltransferase family protein [Promicromonospora iranensis]|uniref:Peptidoglycan/LPS O-acetylase OafA/YrhL n=1 Tax=Promicromonospora iranensis TaxID=1105144 RepID=A0ABU2CSP4_9MICO|nr:acyltransferase family protein [Promicromonospora iranensis]MDR7384369.1 peptidoglycan/LPS O-acetylase OafA/YrhL [Promicromonospora iranensis]
MTDDRKTALRADIQALRAVAVLAVVLFHLWPNRLTGGYVGVDVFFVISGFLITSHIVRDVEAGRFSVTTFWARRMLRLLPASLLVLAVTAVGVWVLAPLQHWEQWFREIAASGLYAQNWILAGDAVDYLAAENVASPVQHYWSLSAEEQFYLVWPLLIGLSLLVGRLGSAPWTRLKADGRHIAPGRVRAGRAGRQASWRPVAAGVLALVVVASLVTSVVWTETDQAYAYFITPTRAWEFGAGALLSFAPALGRRPTARTPAETSLDLSAGMVAWAGLALIAVSAIVFTSATPFPGAFAAIPVLGTVLVIWAQAPDRFTTRLAGLAPVQFLGDVSYAVYLWHWPLIVLVPYATGHDLRTLDKLAILAATILLAWATRHWIEQPVLRHRHRFKPWATFTGAAVVGALVVGAALIGVQTAREHAQTELAAAAEATGSECFGAAARPPHGAGCTNPDLVGTAVPAPEAAGDDMPAPYSTGEDKCAGIAREATEPLACERGDRDSDVRIALVGDSHAAHYSSGFVEAAEANGWAVDIYIKAGCPFSDVMRVQDQMLTTACTGWVDRAEELLLDGDYDLAVTSQVRGVDWTPPDGVAEGTTPEAYAEDGLVSLWARLADNGLPVAAIADVPEPDPAVIECLTAPDVDLAADCRTPRTDATRTFDPQLKAVERLNRQDVALIDLTDVYCDERECFPVIGGVTVYRDDDHLTDTFAGTLAPYLADAMARHIRQDGATR